MCCTAVAEMWNVAKKEMGLEVDCSEVRPSNHNHRIHWFGGLVFIIIDIAFSFEDFSV